MKDESSTHHDDDDSVVSLSAQTRRPLDTALRQQRVRAWYPILDPWWVIIAFLIIGAVFIPVGFYIQNMSDDVIQIIVEYDSYERPHPNCGINNTANANHPCTVEVFIPKALEPPILIHYQLENFYQNHRQYVKSRDDYQLAGAISQSSLMASRCDPLNIINGTRINPCGLIANTMFNDVISLQAGAKSPDGNVDLIMLEEGIAWASDLQYRYKQPDGFEVGECPLGAADPCDETSTCCDEDKWSCKQPYPQDNTCFRYTYPDDDTTQYLYETYPMVVSPLEGVENEHFAVWMRVATLPTFRKLYGWINQPIAAETTLEFDIQNNFEVESFQGAKSLVVSTNNVFGGANEYLGPIFCGIGFFGVAAALFFMAKQKFRPRRIGDKRYLQYKED